MRFRQGGEYNEEKFHDLFVEYQPKIKQFIFKMLHSDSVAEDITHDILLKVWSNFDSFSEIQNVNAYMYKLAKNAAFNHIKAEQIRHKYRLGQEPQEANYSEFEEEYFAREIELLVDLLVSEMPEQRSRIYKMSRHEGLSNCEIAEKLNLSKRTVEGHISLALKHIKSNIIPLVILYLHYKL